MKNNFNCKYFFIIICDETWTKTIKKIFLVNFDQLNEIDFVIKCNCILVPRHK